MSGAEREWMEQRSRELGRGEGRGAGERDGEFLPAWISISRPVCCLIARARMAYHAYEHFNLGRII